jgi:Effector protein
MSLRISTQIYIGKAQISPAVGTEADGFESTVNTALDRIRSTKAGVSMLREIEDAAQEVLVVKAGNNVDNTCVQAVQTEPACDAACYREVFKHLALRTKIQELLEQKKIQEGNPAIQKYMKFHGPNKSAYQTKIGPYKDVPLAHKPKQDRPHDTDQSLNARIAFPVDGPAAIKEGARIVNYLQNSLVAYHIMDHLTPGSGTGAWVVWNPLLQDVGANLPAAKRAAWMNRPPWIALAHELIHGWRLATGRCVFRPGILTEYYYEEAMTVGLPPYDKCCFTENRLRHSKGLPLRTYYGEETLNQSNHAATKHGSVASRVGSIKELAIKVVGSGPNDPLIFNYDIRATGKPDQIFSGKTDDQGHATAQWMDEGEIRFRGFGAFGRIETQWQKISIGRYMVLQFGRYRFICEPH